jgi:hypothetical protein
LQKQFCMGLNFHYTLSKKKNNNNCDMGEVVCHWLLPTEARVLITGQFMLWVK